MGTAPRDTEANSEMTCSFGPTSASQTWHLWDYSKPIEETEEEEDEAEELEVGTIELRGGGVHYTHETP